VNGPGAGPGGSRQRQPTGSATGRSTASICAGRQVYLQNPDGGVQTWARNTAGPGHAIYRPVAERDLLRLRRQRRSNQRTRHRRQTRPITCTSRPSTTLRRKSAIPPPARSSTTKNTYDPTNGDLLTITTDFGTNAAATTTNVWFFGLLQSVTDPDGNVTRYFYDAYRRNHRRWTSMAAREIWQRTRSTLYDGIGKCALHHDRHQPDGWTPTPRPIGFLEEDVENAGRHPGLVCCIYVSPRRAGRDLGRTAMAMSPGMFTTSPAGRRTPKPANAAGLSDDAGGLDLRRGRQRQQAHRRRPQLHV